MHYCSIDNEYLIFMDFLLPFAKLHIKVLLAPILICLIKVLIFRVHDFQVNNDFYLTILLCLEEIVICIRAVYIFRLQQGIGANFIREGGLYENYYTYCKAQNTTSSRST